MTHPAEQLRGSPRFEAIDAVFQAIARGDSTKDVYILMNRTAQNLDYDERRVLPDLVAAELPSLASSSIRDGN